MFDINNEKNKFSVILNPERSEWVSRSHVTGAESVVNAGAKTKRYSAKRDLYGPSLRSTLKMTTLAFLLSLNLSTAFAGITCTLDGTKLTIGGNGTFYGCPDDSETTATEVTIDTGVNGIGYGAFKGAENLTSITIPEGIIWIEERAFWGASSLKSITIPKGPRSIGKFAFADTSSLTSITLPEGLRSIENNAFEGTGLTSITIPEGVTSIGYDAFRYTDSLESITIPDSVKSIGSWAFQDASSLKSITIPEGVTYIGEGTFFRASSLKSITIPDSVTSIGGNAFYGTESLKSITIPEGVTSIGAYAFERSGLKSITIPEGVTSIGYGAFDSSSLESITIPDNINTEKWSSGVFYGGSIWGRDIVCQGDLNTCYEKLAKYFTSKTCPQNLIDAGKGNLCNCSNYCISPSRIKEATDPSQCTGNYVWSGIGCSRKNADGSVTCPSGFVEWDNQCLSEYPFAKKRWTPAEANEWLHDGNDNFVVITFKK